MISCEACFIDNFSKDSIKTEHFYVPKNCSCKYLLIEKSVHKITDPNRDTHNPGDSIIYKILLTIIL